MKQKLFIALSVLLMCSCQQRLIVIDGNFDDWAAVPADRLAQASADENARYKDLYDVKFLADGNVLYFYRECNNEKAMYDVEGVDSICNKVDWFDIFMNVDGNDETGFNSWTFNNSGADILVEGKWAYNFAYARLLTFPADANQNDWAWEDTGLEGCASCCDAVLLPNGHKAIEGKVDMAKFPVPIQSLKVGVYGSTIEWEERGILPQVTIHEDGTDSMSDLLVVPMQ